MGIQYKQSREASKTDEFNADVREAKRLGITYGVYKGYKDTGYLETFRNYHDRQLRENGGRKGNIIYSNIVGG